MFLLFVSGVSVVQLPRNKAKRLNDLDTHSAVNKFVNPYMLWTKHPAGEGYRFRIRRITLGVV